LKRWVWVSVSVMVAGLMALGGLVSIVPASGAAIRPSVVQSAHRPASTRPDQPRRHKASLRSRRQLTVHRDTAPTSNIAPVPDFVDDCGAVSVSVACLNEALAAVDNARSDEGLPAITFSVPGFLALPANEQLFVITNLERTSRGLAPMLALTAQLNAVAAGGATADNDPALRGWTLSGGRPAVEWSSNWAGDLSGFGADYYWMYADGAGVNVDCPSSTATGCWQHRANVLMVSPSLTSCGGVGTPSLVMGASYVGTGYQNTPSIAEIYVGECGSLPSDVTFTWAHAKRLLAIA
jgi:hypothetical protein